MLRVPVRFKIRGMMLAIAAIALLIGETIEGERRRARFHERVARYKSRVGLRQIFAYSGPGGEHRRQKRQEYHMRIAPYQAYDTMLIKKYERAERFPWLPVMPDPPPPAAEAADPCRHL